MLNLNFLSQFTCPTNSSRPTVSFSGSTLPQPISIPWCSKAAVNFTTNNSTVSTGFRLDYHISLGGEDHDIKSTCRTSNCLPNFAYDSGCVQRLLCKVTDFTKQEHNKIVLKAITDSMKRKIKTHIVPDAGTNFLLLCEQPIQSSHLRLALRPTCTATHIPLLVDCKAPS